MLIINHVSDCKTRFLKAIIAGAIALLVCVILKDRIYYDSLFNAAQYSEWGISEWMINYQGGFVRRGLIGQILWLIVKYTSSNPILLIKTISLISAFGFLFVVFRIFTYERWSLFILPLGCCFYYTLFSTWSRKDFIILLLCLAVFKSFKKYLITKSFPWLLIFWLFSATMLLSHEASFFYTYPIILAYSYSFYRSGARKWLPSICLAALPIIFLMATVCFFKGDPSIAKDVWSSWNGSFASFPDLNGSVFDNSHIGTGVNALSWSTSATVKFHISKNFPNVLTIFLTCWMFVAYFFIVSQMNTVYLSFSPLEGDKRRDKISKVLLLQALFMLPLFTILSCDTGRTLSWWVFSSLFAVHVFGDLRISSVERCSVAWLNIYDKIANGHKLVYFVLLLTVPFTMVNGPILDNIWLYRMIKYLALKL